MQLALPFESLLILYRLQTAGYESYLVGGAVRDALRGELTAKTDYDFTTNAIPEQIQVVFPESYYENSFGTVSITRENLWKLAGLELEETALTSPQEDAQSSGPIDLASATKIHSSLQSAALPQHDQVQPHDEDYEITTYRAEGRYTDHRRPDEVKWGKSLEDDLSRRDFTINAMAISIKLEFLDSFFAKRLTAADATQLVNLPEGTFTLIDPYNGRTDLAENILRPVGDPATRFEEDALRMLRAIRFSVQLNLRMTDETFTAISSLADQIQYVSWERIRDEFLKMLASEYPAEAVELLDDTGLLHYILPELREGKGIEQGGHHTTDVWTHSLDALASCPSHDPIVRFATLLHDVGKPRTLRFVDEDPTFYNHEIIGARMARKIAERFRLSKKEVDRVYTLVRHHMFYYQPHNTDASIRRFMRKVGLENINDILDLREADRLGSGARKTSWRLEEMKQRMIAQLHQPFAVTDLAIDGTDVMEALNIKPGRLVGKLLQDLFEEVLDEPDKNNREYLLKRVSELARSAAYEN
ncbi:HD domain-containing protein [Patescibacteria group bacterium]|nr:HD domain-containing protein [Patescibacteria group bacterium]